MCMYPLGAYLVLMIFSALHTEIIYFFPFAFFRCCIISLLSSLGATWGFFSCYNKSILRSFISPVCGDDLSFSWTFTVKGYVNLSRNWVEVSCWYFQCVEASSPSYVCCEMVYQGDFWGCSLLLTLSGSSASASWTFPILTLSGSVLQPSWTFPTVPYTASLLEGRRSEKGEEVRLGPRDVTFTEFLL